MKKLLVLLLVFAMLLSLVACGEENKSEKKESDQASTESQPTEPKGTTYDTGEFQVFIPDGWYAIPCTDVWAEEADVLDPTALHICKGGDNDFDIFTKPYIRIDHYDENTMMGKPDKEWYDDGVDLEPFTTGEHTWTGFSATTLGYPIVVLWAQEGGDEYQIAIYTDQEDGKISIDDADVQEILASITVNNP